MGRILNRIAARIWLLTAAVSLLTAVIGLGSLYVATWFDLIDTAGQMPPAARAELHHLVTTGQKGSDRYFEIYDKYSGDDLRGSDLLLIVAISTVATLIGGIAALLLARRISRPITAVADAAAKVAAGQHHVRVVTPRVRGEVGELIDSFNRMAEDLEHYERERTVLTAGIAHELRTPLTVLRGRLHGLADGVIDPVSGEADRLLRQVERLTRLVEDLRTLAHVEGGVLALDLRTIDVNDVVRSALDDLRPEADRAGVTFSHDAADDAIVLGDPSRIWQILANLLGNAIKHSPPGGTIGIVTSRDDEHVRIAVIDEGPGIASGERERLFIPFWRGEADRAAGLPGSGLGLALAGRLAEANRGRIEVPGRPDGTGAAFILLLPLQARQPAGDGGRST